MPELGPLGSVRGALSNERPYRDRFEFLSQFAERQDIDRLYAMRLAVLEHGSEHCADGLALRVINTASAMICMARPSLLAETA